MLACEMLATGGHNLATRYKLISEYYNISRFKQKYKKRLLGKEYAKLP